MTMTVKPVMASMVGTYEEWLQGHINCIPSSFARTFRAQGITSAIDILVSRRGICSGLGSRAEDLPAGSELKTDPSVRL
jgi:hypothetical protein